MEVRRQTVRVMAPGSELWLSHSAAITFTPRAILLPEFFFTAHRMLFRFRGAALLNLFLGQFLLKI